MTLRDDHHPDNISPSNHLRYFFFQYFDFTRLLAKNSSTDVHQNFGYCLDYLKLE